MNSNDNRGGGIGTAMAGIIGMAVGAAAAIIVMSDKKTRKKVEDKFNELKETGAKKMDEFKQMSAEKKAELDEQVKKKATPQYEEDYEA